jgi:3'-phosphoadenosine 5'-phosphosulfate (PAPS) 3'-phosphatase
VIAAQEEDPMVARNRFEQVDELQPDAVNLTLIQKSDGQVGIIHCPQTAAPDQLPGDLTSAEMPIRDAVSGAVQLANSKKLPMVVIDRDNIWNAKWGDLWRYEEESEG